MKLAIYQTSDLHGFVYPTNYVTEQKLGILKIGSYILEDEKNYDASLKVDCGDLIQGSVLTNYLSRKQIKSNPIIEGLEKINYDAYVLGNHEFNYGLDYLTNSYKHISDKVINSNNFILKVYHLIQNHTKFLILMDLKLVALELQHHLYQIGKMKIISKI